jgi:phage baseplate assembly protein W
MKDFLDPGIGSNISSLLFELFSPITTSSLQNEIATLIRNYETWGKHRQISG